MLKERNVVLCIVFSLISFGIYGVYWFIQMTNDTAYVNDNPNFSGGKAFLFSIITCGIYLFYWYYKMGKELMEARQKRNLDSKDNSVLYLLLGIFGLGIVSYCIIQSELNEFANMN